MNVLACIKRVPATAGRIALTPDEQEIDTRFLAFTVSPHEECAVEEAVRLTEASGGTSTVLTLGPEAAVEQLQDALALGIGRAVLLETDGREWDPAATAGAIVEAVRAEAAAGFEYDLLLFGTEAADTGDYQVGIRVAHELGLPCVTGAKALEIRNGTAIVRRQGQGVWEVFEVPLPALVTVKEGINLPRYPSIPGRIRAKKQQIERIVPVWPGNALVKVRLKLPVEEEKRAAILGHGPEAAAEVARVLEQLGLAP
jgi:electron transfer flavoprotein beta subunit